jgi:hypothetical protein
MTKAEIEAAAAAIANAHAARRGAPAIANVLEVLQRFKDGKLYAEVMEDAGAALAAAAAVRQRSDPWRTMADAPRDGTAFLAFGTHTHSPPDAQRGIAAGDVWWAIILFDVWRDPHRFVFAKDGAPTWSAPEFWQPLLAPTIGGAR